MSRETRLKRLELREDTPPNVVQAFLAVNGATPAIKRKALELARKLKKITK